MNTLIITEAMLIIKGETTVQLRISAVLLRKAGRWDVPYAHYEEHGIDTSLFMKLVEEVGEVAEVLNKRDGRKASDNEDLKSQLANELVDVIHYAFAIASLNEIDLNDVILEKDKKASIKYNHERNLEQFMLER